jgi:hypothetical protein
MKQLQILLSFLIFGLLSCSNDSDLISGNIYEINSQSIDISPTIITQKKEHQLTLKPFKIYLRILDNNKSDVVIQSQDNFYSFSGDIEILEELKGMRNRSYSFSLNGYRRSYLNFLLDTKTKKISTYSNSIISKLETTYNPSEVSIEFFSEIFEKGRENEFYPLNMIGTIEEYQIEDYWLSYFDIDYVVVEREQKRNEELEKKRELELLEQSRKEKAERLRQRRDQLCSLIENFDIRQLIRYGATNEALNTINRGGNIYEGDKDEWDYTEREKLYAKRNSDWNQYGYIDKEGVLLDKNGESYIGPFTIYLDQVYVGNFKLGLYPLFDEIKYYDEDFIKKMKNYLTECSSIENHLKKYVNQKRTNRS